MQRAITRPVINRGAGKAMPRNAVKIAKSFTRPQINRVKASPAGVIPAKMPRMDLNVAKSIANSRTGFVPSELRNVEKIAKENVRRR